MLREKEIENTAGYIWINSILKKLEELELITGKELESTDKNISKLLNVEYKYSCIKHTVNFIAFGNRYIHGFVVLCVLITEERREQNGRNHCYTAEQNS